MKPYLCLGGPNDEAIKYDYVDFNCSSGGVSTKHKIARMKRDGEIVIPTMVRIHKSLFQKYTEIL